MNNNKKMITGLKYMLVSLSFFFACSLKAQNKTNPANQDKELGKVSWYRDYETATKIAKKEKKAVLILFQEVPGCATCRNYGHNVLSHPLMVEAIENLFVPLAIYNNKGGKDKQILKKYNEPSWNNPVVRIVNAQGVNLIDRLANDYSAVALHKAMKNVLEKTNTPIPTYFNLLGAELITSKSGKIAETYFKMHCFWTGEKQLGKLNGVLSTKSGFINGSEVVKVTYDKDIISESKLSNYANKNNCQPIKNKGNYKLSAKDLNYYLQHSNYKYLPLTELQKTKINSALGNNKSATKYLSPKQKVWLSQFSSEKTKHKILFDKNFTTAWNIMDTSKN